MGMSVESLKSDAGVIMEVKRLTFALKFDEALNLTRQIQDNEFAVRTALLVVEAEHSHKCGCFTGDIATTPDIER
jgi:hypothetical protein